MKHPILEELEETLGSIEGAWNGDESGSAEDMARAAHEALAKVKELKALLEELNISL